MCNCLKILNFNNDFLKNQVAQDYVRKTSYDNIASNPQHVFLASSSFT